MTPEMKNRIEQIQRGEVPEGYKKTRVGIVPEEWQASKLRDMFDRLNRKNKVGNTNVLTISAQHGLISQEEYFNKSVASEDKSNYFLLERGDFAYNKSYSKGYPFGAIKPLTSCDEGIVSPLYICFEPSKRNTCPEYFAQYFDGGLLNREIQAVAQEGARNHGLLNIGVNDFFSANMAVPSLAEQKRIAEILATQDKVIALQSRKIDELKKLKKCYLSKMFPKRGSNVPELRFSGFTGDWEQRKLSELAEKTYGGGTPATSDERFWNGNIPWIQSSDIVDGKLFDVVPRKYITQEGLNNSASQLVPENSIAIITRVGVGKLAFMPFSYTTSQDFLSLSKLNTEPFFTVYACYKNLHSELYAVQGTSIKGITKDELLAKTVMVPEYAEQQKIGAYFKHLDNLITLHQRMLEEMKSNKKALMQLLLTGIVRVNV